MFFSWGIASSMTFTLLPLFWIDKLGGNHKSFGLVEGGVLFISFAAKVFAGVLTDIFRKKKPMLLCGTLLTLLGKVLFACINGVVFAFVAKSVDRFAKGLRSAASDAILADLSTRYNFAYYTKHMMNVAGSLTGSIIVTIIISLLGCNYRLIFGLAVIPTIISYYILVQKLKYESDTVIEKKQKWKLGDVKLLPKEYWQFITIVAILMFCRFSEGFISLLAKEVMPEGVANIPIFMGVYEVCVICAAILIGRFSNKVDCKLILFWGILLLMVTDIIAIFANSPFLVLLIYIGAGLHMGATHGILSSIVAQNSSKNIIGTAFGLYYCIDGIFLFISNYFAGASGGIATSLGLRSASGPFIQGAIFSAIACCYIFKLLSVKSSQGKM
jgi:MFS family permease